MGRVKDLLPDQLDPLEDLLRVEPDPSEPDVRKPRLTGRVARGLCSVRSLAMVELQNGSDSGWAEAIGDKGQEEAVAAIVYIDALLAWRASKQPT
jgi:hypothetical protein